MGVFGDLLGMAIGAGINAVSNEYQKYKLENADEIHITFTTPDNTPHNYGVLVKAEALEILFKKIAQYMGIEIKKEYNGIFFKLFYEEAIGPARGGRSEEISILENFALYNGKFIVIKGVRGMGNGGISIIGEGCFELAQKIADLLKQLKCEDIQYVDGPIEYPEKKALFAAVNELIANSEEYFEGEDEEVGENEEDEDDEDEYLEEDSEEENDDEIITLCNFFKIEYSSLDKAALKKSYHNMMTQYHPDKVNNLADDFKELADKKTKEINEKYEILLAFLEQKDK